MPIVKGVSCDRIQKVMIKADTLEEVITQLTNKFKLRETEEYKVVLEADGTVLDSSDIFTCLCEEAKENKIHLSVMVLPSSEQWPDPHNMLTPTTASVPFSPSDSRRDSSPTSSRYLREVTRTPLTSRQPNHAREQAIEIPAGISMSTVALYLDPILECMENNSLPRNFQALKKAAIKECYTHVGDIMRLKRKDFSKEVARVFAKQIIFGEEGKYQEIFAFKIGNVTVDDGVETLTQQIYGHINYRKDDSLKQKRSKRKRLDDTLQELECEDELHEDSVPVYHQSMYGMKAEAFNPPLPAGEDEESQNIKRELLLKIENPLSDEVFALMDATYASQRRILSMKLNPALKVEKTFSMRPLLKHPRHFLNHAKIMMKNVVAVWGSAMGERAPKVVAYMTDFWKQESRKARPVAACENMLKVLKEKNEALQTLRSQTVIAIASFPLIVGYMKEQENHLFLLLDCDTPDEDMLSTVKQISLNPVLVIKGSSIYNENSKCCVVIMGKEILSVPSVLDGFLILIVAYYMFDMVYPTPLHSTLEFIQRFYLDVNPAGVPCAKRAKKKRTVDSVDSKVKNLAEEVQKHSSVWRIPTPDEDAP